MKGWVFMDTLSDIRIDIDNIDRQLLRLLAQRQILVEKAGRLKPKGDKVAVQA
jgi:isochorismate pyruvate lyase